MIKQNTVSRLIAVITLLFLLAPNVSAECSIQDAEKRIKEFYEAISETFREPNSGKSLLKWRKNVLPMLPEAFSFPDEPRLLFGDDESDPFLEPYSYFNKITKRRLENICTEEEREVLQISMDCQYGQIKPISYPAYFAGDPAGRCVMVDYYEMNVTKTYKITNIVTNAAKTYTLHDTIYVRARDGVIACLENECYGGNSFFSHDEFNNEDLIELAASAWNREDYQEAYRLYRKVIEKNPNNPSARACFHLGLMMYDQYEGRAVYNPDIDKNTAKKFAINYWKKGAQMKDEPGYAEQCYQSYCHVLSSQ